MILEILFYFAVLQLGEYAFTMSLEHTQNISLKPFGSLDDDWKRLDLLEKLQPKDSKIRAELVHACRLLLTALYQNSSLNSEESRPKLMPFVQNFNNSWSIPSNISSREDGVNRLIATTERLLKLYNNNENGENSEDNLLDTNSFNDNNKMDPKETVENAEKEKERADYTSSLLTNNNVGLRYSTESDEKNVEDKNPLNAFDRTLKEAEYKTVDNCTNSSRKNYLAHGNNKHNHDYQNNSAKLEHNSSSLCGKKNKLKFPEHDFNWTDSLSSTESELSLQYFNINIFQNTYIGSTSNLNDSMLSPTEGVPMDCRGKLINLTENVQYTGKKVGTLGSKNIANFKNNLVGDHSLPVAQVEDVLLSERRDGKSKAVAIKENVKFEKEPYLNNINTNVSFTNSTNKLSDGHVNLNQDNNDKDSNRKVLLTFNDKVSPNISTVSNGQIMTVPQDQIEEIVDLDKVVQKFLDSIYNNSISIRKDFKTTLQDNFALSQSNSTDERSLKEYGNDNAANYNDQSIRNSKHSVNQGEELISSGRNYSSFQSNDQIYEEYSMKPGKSQLHSTEKQNLNKRFTSMPLNNPKIMLSPVHEASLKCSKSPSIRLGDQRDEKLAPFDQDYLTNAHRNDENLDSSTNRIKYFHENSYSGRNVQNISHFENKGPDGLKNMPNVVTLSSSNVTGTNLRRNLNYDNYTMKSADFIEPSVGNEAKGMIIPPLRENKKLHN